MKQVAGIGLRAPHLAEVGRDRPATGFLEIHAENYLAGSPALQAVERLRADYAFSVHAVGLSLGSAEGLDEAHLARVAALVKRLEPAWVSDHLSWSVSGGRYFNDLLPLPYTEEALDHVAERVMAVQDHLGQRLVLENVSSYVTYAASELSEWEFIAELAKRADCEILLDVNNVYVSAFNHEFDAMAFLRAMPRARVRQFHLAGHTHKGSHIIDTHDHPIVPDVWDLYAEAVKLFPGVPTMIERDADIPPYAELLAELDQARGIAARVARQAAA
jgi:hypothetical protein